MDSSMTEVSPCFGIVNARIVGGIAGIDIVLRYRCTAGRKWSRTRESHIGGSSVRVADSRWLASLSGIGWERLLTAGLQVTLLVRTRSFRNGWTTLRHWKKMLQYSTGDRLASRISQTIICNWPFVCNEPPSRSSQTFVFPSFLFRHQRNFQHKRMGCSC